MKCKYCFAELEEDATICPICGKNLTETEETPVEEIVEETAEETAEEVTEVAEEETTEETVVIIPAKKKIPKELAITLAAIGGLVLAAALALAVLYGMGYKLSSIGAFLGFTEAKVDYKDNYFVSDQQVEKKANTVIARVGDQTLTNEQLQVYFWMAAREYISQYNTALSMGQTVELGFDPAKPLNEQVYDPKTGKTWQQFFLETALQQWQNYASIVQLAKDAGYVMPQEIQDYLDSYDEEMSALALQAGFTDVEALIDEQISKGSSAAAHYHTFEMEYTALAYLETREKELKPTDKEIEDYYKANEKALKSQGFGKDAGKYYDVRHIFVTVKGEMSQLEDGTYGYTEEQWNECYDKAKKLLDDFLANKPTEDKFAALAKEHSEDGGSASNGGLYAYLTKDTGFVEDFKDWYMDESRKPGDTGIVKNTGSAKVGYHVMYFSKSMEIWKDEAETQVINEKMRNLLKTTAEKYPISVNYKELVLGQTELIAQK